MFYCREKELSDLNRRYSEGKFECAIVYGRRRVGKTALINEFCKNKPTIFFSALNATSGENLEALSRAIYEKDHKDGTSAPVYQSFDDALSDITRMAEHLTVNQGVTGSSPVGGAIKTLENTAFSRVFCYLARSERTSKNPLFKVSGHTHPNDC